jgi:hypothetical protein
VRVDPPAGQRLRQVRLDADVERVPTRSPRPSRRRGVVHPARDGERRDRYRDGEDRVRGEMRMEVGDWRER